MKNAGEERMKATEQTAPQAPCFVNPGTAALFPRFLSLAGLDELPAHLSPAQPELLISNYIVDPAEDICRLVLRPYEARVYRL